MDLGLEPVPGDTTVATDGTDDPAGIIAAAQVHAALALARCNDA